MLEIRRRSLSLLLVTPLLLAGACHRAPAAKTTAPAAKTAAAPAAAPNGAPAAAAAPVATKAELPTITAAALAKTLSAKTKPLLFQVGFEKLYQQAHIPGSEYLGPAMSPAGIQRLEARVAKLPHDTPIVIYCGCCPWSHCPNVLPAYQALQKLGFTHVKVLAIPEDFGADWVSKGYPVASGA